MNKKILLVEDEAGLIMTISDRLIANGYALDSATNIKDARNLALSKDYDVLVLDVMLPDGDGMELCAFLRTKKIGTPIILLTAKSLVGDRVKGLQHGADDYLCKPFSMSELLARIAALLRRSSLGTGNFAAIESTIYSGTGTEESTILAFGLWHLDARTRLLTKTNSGVLPQELSTTEFRLLAYLHSHPNEVLSRDKLLDEVWGYNNEVGSRTVDVHIAWLRQKLGENDEPMHIHTVRRGGYRFTL